ncbi:hypothetical protein PYCC9005_005578 [Savitreella phatthalungensis]
MSTNAATIFPIVAKTLRDEPRVVKKLRGHFQFIVTRPGSGTDDEIWYLCVDGQNRPPHLSQDPVKNTKGVPLVVIHITDKDLLAWVAGKVSTMRGIVGGRIKTIGDVNLAFEIEDVFREAGGIRKTREYLNTRREKKTTKL